MIIFAEYETAFVNNPSGTSTNEFCATTTDKKSLLSKKSKSSDNSDGAGKS